MSRRVRGEDRIEMIIRGLLKQPENRKCINCNSLGPQYVCTTFWTFVCTNCSGVHRSFTHRVKSVSVAKFNEEEIAALQACGNERAREIYFKDWNPRCDHYPDGSNTQKLREFIKHVYVDKKYAGSNSSSKDTGKPEDRYGFRKSGGDDSKDEYTDRCFIDQKSSIVRNKGRSFRDIFEHRSSINMEEDLRSSRQRTRVAKFELVDDRFRDDGKVKRYQMHLSKESRAGSMSPCSGRRSSLPGICPVEDLIGHKVVLEIGGAMTFTEDKKATEATFQAHKVVLKDNDAKEFKTSDKALKTENPTVPGPASELKMKMQTGTVNSSSLFDEPTSIAEPSTKAQTDDNLPQMTSLESLLYELSLPMTTASSSVNEAGSSSSKAIDVETTRSTQVSNGVDAIKKDVPTRSDTGQFTLLDAQVHQLPPPQKNETLASFGSSSFTNMELNVTSPISEMSIQENQSALPKKSKPSKTIVPVEKASKISNPNDGKEIAARKELPQDLFCANFGSFTQGASGWQMHQPHGTGYAMQLRPPATCVTNLQYAPASRNPFDIGDERLQVEVPRFPSIQQIRSLANTQPAQPLVPQPFSYSSPFFPNQISMPQEVPGVYTELFTNNMQFTRPQGVADLGSYSSFPSSNTIHQPKGGNPFG